MKNIKEQLRILTRNVVDSLPEGELEKKLAVSIKENRPLRVKQGFDPTAPDIHLGHTVGLRKLREFQELGHTVVVIVGDYTALVGDPSGRSATRPQLTSDQVESNAKTYLEQFFKIVDRNKAEVRRNGEWFSKMNFKEILELCSRFTIARMLERDDFEKRYKSGSPISIHELLYPLMQAYDSVAIKADIEIGGTEQLFNLLAGRQIQEAFGVEPQVALTLPILEGLDGEQRMSKSIGNYIGVAESAGEIFGKIMSIPDKLILSYFRLLTDLPDDEIGSIEKQLADTTVNPMDTKKHLGVTIASMYASPDEAIAARENFEKVFSQKQVPDIEPTLPPPEGYSPENTLIYWPKALADWEIMTSSSAARRLIEQGGFHVDGERIMDFSTALPFTEEHILKVGKRGWYKTKKVDEYPD
ncbi:MAG: tyrosine--tRNA ligase [candidate division Zixibacteria bacterium]|nr:tyrosine--tRNA ligase [candidate division Zixibacteria bacterium]MBU1469701.1 tyrosine--tRNA ligase [candidate division Zixibacteria bacterium]MBU2626091.1 tyrosine--tRNA ligase [candidate division Zixibacteria bacterium]